MGEVFVVVTDVGIPADQFAADVSRLAIGLCALFIPSQSSQQVSQIVVSDSLVLPVTGHVGQLADKR